MKEPLVILTGPTAVGKTSLSLSLAEAVNAEIISADSVQVYRRLDIGSAKLPPGERRNVPHHLIDVLEPEEEFNVVRFQKLAKEAASGIRERGRLPLVVGGTGFYIQALLYDVDFDECSEDRELRGELEAYAASAGPEALHARLEEVDPEAARKIHPNNVRRVIRALEYHSQTGKCISGHNEAERRRESPYNFAYFVLSDDRERLYRRIDERVDEMMSDGFLDEVKALKASGLSRDLPSMHGLGYSELMAYLDGEYSLDEAVRLIKRNTRHFAKRQLTWFRREREVIRLDRTEYGDDENALLEKMLTVLREKGIIT